MDSNHDWLSDSGRIDGGGRGTAGDGGGRGTAGDGGLSRRALLSLAAAGITVPGAATAASTAETFVEILSVDPTAYPQMLVNVSVDTSAGTEGRLTEDDFQIIEDGVQREIQSFNFGSTASDVVFVFDDSGSMGNEIDAMKAEVNDLVAEIEAAGIDARYGLVTFKDRVEGDLPLTDDASALKSRVDGLYASGGGDFPEDNFDAIAKALSYDFRDDAQKILVDITDATAHHDGDGSGYTDYTIEEIGNELVDSGVAYIAVSPGYADDEGAKKVLADNVDGTWIDIYEADFTVILGEIIDLVVTAYVLQYTTGLGPGEVAPISIIVDDPNAGTGRADGTADVPEDVGGSVLTTLISDKRTRIDDVQAYAGFLIDEWDVHGKAGSDVDLRAAAYLDELEPKTDDLDGAAVDQHEEALERLNAAEEISETYLDDLNRDDSGDTVVGHLSHNFVEPIKSIALDAVWSRLASARGLASSAQKRIGGSIFDDFFQSMRRWGDGIFKSSRFAGSPLADDIGRALRGLKRSERRAYDEYQDDLLNSYSTAVETAFSEGIQPLIPDDWSNAIAGLERDVESYVGRGFVDDLLFQENIVDSTLPVHVPGYTTVIDLPESKAVPHAGLANDASGTLLDWVEEGASIPGQIKELPNYRIEELEDLPDEPIPEEIDLSFLDPLEGEIGYEAFSIDSASVLEEVENYGVTQSSGVDVELTQEIDALAEAIGSLDIQEDDVRETLRGHCTAALGSLSGGAHTIFAGLNAIRTGLDVIEAGYSILAIAGAVIAIALAYFSSGLSLLILPLLGLVGEVIALASIVVWMSRSVTGLGYLSATSRVHNVGVSKLLGSNLEPIRGEL